jgi:hypothetical protein
VATTIKEEASFLSRVFLCGADMDPVEIRKRWPESRFLGIAWASGDLVQGIGLSKGALGPRLWGIVIETGQRQRGHYLPITMRDGTSTTAVLTATPDTLGTLPEILSEAHYWELPRDYRDRLQALVDAS